MNRGEFLLRFDKQIVDGGQVRLELPRGRIQVGAAPVLYVAGELLEHMIVLQDEAHQLLDRMPRAAQEV